jgi:hypothetical protein
MQFRPPIWDENVDHFEAKNISLRSNLIVGGYGAVRYENCVDCIVEHNTIVDPENWVVRVALTQTDGLYHFDYPNEDYYIDFDYTEAGVFVNNLVYWDSTEPFAEWNINPAADNSGLHLTFSSKYNFWYDHVLSTDEIEYNGIPNSFETNPTSGFSFVEEDYYTIGPSSGPVGVGTSSAAVLNDRFGTAYDNPPSAGAFEP